MMALPRFIRLVLALLFVATLNSIQIEAAQRGIGSFKSYAHDLKTAEVTLRDTKTMFISNLVYDGTGPDAWFQVKTRERPDSPHTNPGERDDLTKNKKIPDENGSCDLLKGYKGKDITLTLPGNLTFANVEYVAMYCYQYKHNFGYINIPNDLSGLNQFPADKKVPDFCNGASEPMANTIRSGSALLLSTSLILFSFALTIVR